MRTIPFKRRIITASVRIIPDVTPKKEGFTMSTTPNLGGIVTDGAAEIKNVEQTVADVETLVKDVKAGAPLSTLVGDVEKVGADVASDVTTGEKIAKDI